jgi:hypothetical protein
MDMSSFRTAELILADLGAIPCSRLTIALHSKSQGKDGVARPSLPCEMVLQRGSLDV